MWKRKEKNLCCFGVVHDEISTSFSFHFSFYSSEDYVANSQCTLEKTLNDWMHFLWSVYKIVSKHETKNLQIKKRKIWKHRKSFFFFCFLSYTQRRASDKSENIETKTMKNSSNKCFLADLFNFQTLHITHCTQHTHYHNQLSLSSLSSSFFFLFFICLVNSILCALFTVTNH